MQVALGEEIREDQHGNWCPHSGTAQDVLTTHVPSQRLRLLYDLCKLVARHRAVLAFHAANIAGGRVRDKLAAPPPSGYGTVSFPSRVYRSAGWLRCLDAVPGRGPVPVRCPCR